MQDTKKVTIVDLSGSRNKLTQNMYKVWNVRSTDTKVNKTPYNMTIMSRILKRFTISGHKVNIELHGSLNNPVISKRSRDKKNPSGVEISIPIKYCRGPRSGIRNWSLRRALTKTIY
jgi:hypothetical protein